jgi:hypothetical protein
MPSTPADRAGHEVSIMSRYERTQYFEALCRLRATHEAATDDDRRSILSVEDAIAHAEAVLVAYDAADEEARISDELAPEESTAPSDV